MCPATDSIEVQITRSDDASIDLSFFVTGKIAALNLPAPASTIRSDALWRHSCFELFALTDVAGYHEFNFAPSTAWAAYSFTGRRTGMSASAFVVPPRIDTHRTADRYELRVSLAFGSLPGLPDNRSWRIGLSAVIEDVEGRRSYWALAHPPGDADFHHPDCFAAELPAPHAA